MKLSAALVAAVAAAATSDPEPCPACLEPANRGLCHSYRCQRQVLPQQKQPSWHRDAHSSLYHELGEAAVDERELSPAALKVKRRRERTMQRVLGRKVAAGRELVTQIFGGRRTRFVRTSVVRTAHPVAPVG